MDICRLRRHPPFNIAETQFGQYKSRVFGKLGWKFAIRIPQIFSNKKMLRQY